MLEFDGHDSNDCGFIIYVANEEDKAQLKKNEAYLKKYAVGVTNDFNALPYCNGKTFESVDNLSIGDFVRILVGEYYEFGEEYGMDNLMQNIAHDINDGYGKLKYYADSYSRLTLGEKHENS